MSTKIYDAYKIKTGSFYDFSKFIQTLKKECINKNVSYMNDLILEKAVDIIDEVTIAKSFPNDNIVNPLNKLISSYYDDFYIAKKNLIKEIDKINFVKGFSPRTIAMEIILTKISLAEKDNTIFTQEYDMKNSIAIFPLNNKYSLLMVFGNEIKSLVNRILISTPGEEWNEFKTAYEICDYHYQNQTDRPDDIDAKSWNKRKRDWNKAMPNYIPSKDGIVIELTNGKMMESEYYDNLTKYYDEEYPYKEKFPKKNRADSYVLNKMLNKDNSKEYFKQKALLTQKDPETMEEYNRLLHKIEDVLYDINNEVIFNMKFLNEILSTK